MPAHQEAHQPTQKGLEHEGIPAVPIRTITAHQYSVAQTVKEQLTHQRQILVTLAGHQGLAADVQQGNQLGYDIRVATDDLMQALDNIKAGNTRDSFTDIVEQSLDNLAQVRAHWSNQPGPYGGPNAIATIQNIANAITVLRETL